MMILCNLHLPLVLLVVRLVLGQTFNQGDAAAMAWRGYGNFVRNALLGGSSIGTFKIYVTPPTLIGIPAGDPVPNANTNYQVFQVADGLQSTTDPYTRQGERSYINSLEAYINAVNFSTIVPNSDQLTQWNSYFSTMTTAQGTRSDTYFAALNQYRSLFAHGVTLPTLLQWIAQSYPAFNTAQSLYRQSRQHFQDFNRLLFGDPSVVLSRQINNINDAQARTDFLPGITMRADPRDVSIPAMGPYTIAPEPDVENTVLLPQYTISGLESQCNDWLNDVSGQRTTYTFIMSRSQMNNWKSFGFNTSTRPTGGGVLFGLLGAKTSTTTEITEFSEWNSTFESTVEMVLTLQGRPAAFDVTAGLWDVNGVRQIYPKLLANNADLLKDQVRVTRILMGFRPSITMTIKDMSTWITVRDWVKNVTEDSQAGIRLFGFSLGTAGYSIESRNITELQITEDESGGSLYIPPGADRVPVVLGVMGRPL